MRSNRQKIKDRAHYYYTHKAKPVNMQPDAFIMYCYLLGLVDVLGENNVDIRVDLKYTNFIEPSE